MILIKINEIMILSKLHLQGSIPFGQLPVYKEGDFYISHMGSILRYIARKYNFEGEMKKKKHWPIHYL